MNNIIHQAIACFLIILALSLRLLPHPPNFTPVIAVALFSGVVFSKNWLSFTVPAASLFFSNWVLGFSRTSFMVLLIITGISFLGKKINTLDFGKLNPLKWAIESTAASIVFFLLSNLLVWIEGDMYALNLEGFISCYVFALPFFHNTLFSTLIYAFVLKSFYFQLKTTKNNKAVTIYIFLLEIIIKISLEKKSSSIIYSSRQEEYKRYLLLFKTCIKPLLIMKLK